MSGKSYEEIEKRLQERLEKRSNWWEVLQRHPDFIHFCKTRFPETRLDKIRIELNAWLPPWLPPALSINLLDIIALPPPLRISPEDQVLISFLETRKGEALARKYGLYPLEKPAVQVIPHQKARDINDRKLKPRNYQGRLALYLRDGRFLHLRIDCSESLTQIMGEVKLQINRYRPLVLAGNAPARPCFKPHLKGKWLHIELDLVNLHMGSLEKALSEAKKKVKTKPKRRGISLEKEDIEIYDRVQRGESYEAIGREAPEYDLEDPNADPQDAKRQRAGRSYRKVKSILI